MNRSKPKPNSSILSFFKKSDGPVTCPRTQSRITDFRNSSPRNIQNNGGNGVSRLAEDDDNSLFVRDTLTGTPQANHPPSPPRQRSKTPDDFWESPTSLGGGQDEDRYNENGGVGVKKRKVSHGGEETPEGNISSTNEGNSSSNRKIRQKAQKRHGPFIDESDSEDDLDIMRRDGLSFPGGNTEIAKDDTLTPVSGTAADTNNVKLSTGSGINQLMAEDNAEAKDPTGMKNEGGLALDSGEDSHREPGITKNEILENEVGDEAIQDPADDVNAYDFSRFEVDSCTDIADEETPICPVCQTSLGRITEIVSSRLSLSSPSRSYD